MTPSGFVGSGKDSDIRDLLFVLVAPRCGDDTHAVAMDGMWEAPLKGIVWKLRLFV
jgi:hypothetical protein